MSVFEWSLEPMENPAAAASNQSQRGLLISVNPANINNMVFFLLSGGCGSLDIVSFYCPSLPPPPLSISGCLSYSIDSYPVTAQDYPQIKAIS